MISVVIPALNEGATVASVVAFAWRAPGVRQVIVVDDGSIDDTVAQAQKAGAEVMTSTLLGKGASMHDGLRAASQAIVVYLDGDLRGLSEDLIPRLTAPLIANDADFVKASFARGGGRVTALTARPLVCCFFPELAHLEQPLGGIVAARRSVLDRLEFETDFGVDVGLLIDAALAGARFREVDVGRIEHDNQPLDGLRPMAFQVASTIFDRASRHGRLRPSYVREARLQDRRQRAEQYQTHRPIVIPWRRLALLDMDGVLLHGRYVVELAQRSGRRASLQRLLDANRLPAHVRTQQIAALLRGVPFEVFEQVAMDMPLTPGAVETVIELRRLGYCVGIVTDCYAIVAELVRSRVFADFCVGHLLHFNGADCRGRLTIAPLMEHDQGCPTHRSCKRNVLHHFVGTDVPTNDRVIVIGDGENDICLLRAVEQSFAFEPKSDFVATAARHVIHDDLREVLRLLETGSPEEDAERQLDWDDDPLRQIA